MQKLREGDRLKNKLVEKKMKKEIILVLNGQIPPSLQKELAMEPESQSHDHRQAERMERSEPIRVDAKQRMSGQATRPAESLIPNLTDHEADEAAATHHDGSEDSSDSESDSPEKEHATSAAAHHDSAHSHRTSIAPAINRTTSTTIVRSLLIRSQSSASVGSRPGTTTTRTGSSRSRQGTPGTASVSTHVPPLILDPNETPVALLTLREGVAALDQQRQHLLALIDDEVRAMNELGVPVHEQGEPVGRCRTQQTMDSLQEGEEEGEEDATKQHQTAGQVRHIDRRSLVTHGDAIKGFADRRTVSQ
jgi:hypothetical protein